MRVGQVQVLYCIARFGHLSGLPCYSYSRVCGMSLGLPAGWLSTCPRQLLLSAPARRTYCAILAAGLQFLLWSRKKKPVRYKIKKKTVIVRSAVLFTSQDNMPFRRKVSFTINVSEKLYPYLKLTSVEHEF